MIKNLFRAEINKLEHSSQLMVMIIILVIYVAILPFFIASPGSYSVFERYRNITSDIAVMTIIISLAASVLYASEYTQNTMKNIVQYFNRRQVFFTKLVVMFLTIGGMLLLWYLLGILVVAVQTQEMPNVIIFINYIKRYSVQVLLVSVQALILVTLSIIFKKQAIVNICSFVCFFILSFTPCFQWVLANYFWGNWGAPMIYISLLLICILFTGINYFLFARQEIK